MTDQPNDIEIADRRRRPISQSARERLRHQARHEQELAAHVAAAEARLDAERRRRKDTIAALDRAVIRRENDVADALITYVDTDGLGLERAALILGRAKATLAKTVRRRRADLAAEATRRGTKPLSNWSLVPGLDDDTSPRTPAMHDNAARQSAHDPEVS